MLNNRQQRFVDEYLIDLNATQAAIRAGYSENTASEQGFDLLRNPKVAQVIAERQAKIQKRLEITQDRVVLELARIAFADIRDLMSWKDDRLSLKDSADLDEDAARTIASIKEKRRTTGRGEDTWVVQDREVKMHDKLKALEMLARHLGIFNDKLRIETATDEARKLASELGLDESEVLAELDNILNQG